MLHVFSSLLDVPWEVEKVLAFPEMFGLTPVALQSYYKTKYQQYSTFHVVRFNTVTLLILISPQTFSNPSWLRIMIHIRFSLLSNAHRS